MASFCVSFFKESTDRFLQKMAQHEKQLHTALHAQTSYHHGVNG